MTPYFFKVTSCNSAHEHFIGYILVLADDLSQAIHKLENHDVGLKPTLKYMKEHEDFKVEICDFKEMLTEFNETVIFLNWDCYN